MTLTDLHRWLKDYAERSGVIAAGVILRIDSRGQSLAKAAEWPAEGKTGRPLMAAAQAAIQRAENIVVVPAVNQTDSLYTRIIALPLRSENDVLGSIAIALSTADSDIGQNVLHELTGESQALVKAMALPPRDIQPLAITHVMHLQAALLNHHNLKDGATALVSEVATKLGFDRVALGLMQEGRIELVALSNSTETHTKRDLMRGLAAALEEATDQNETVIYPPLATDKPMIRKAHADLVARTGTYLFSVPLIHAGSTIGAMSFERESKPVDAAAEIELCEHLASLIAPVIEIMQRAERPWHRQLGQRMIEGWRGLRRQGLRGVMVMGIIPITLLATALFPVMHHVGAPVRVEGAEQRIIAAPLDSFINRALVRPGDEVRAGQVLIELVEQDLLLEQRRWRSALAQHQNAYTAALARTDRPQFAISHAKATEARAQLNLVEKQLERTRLTAPIDGIVIQGDLTQSLGAPVQLGEVLLTVAPRHDFRLMIEVDERDIESIQPGKRGRLALAAIPGETIAFQVKRVTPVAVTRDGNNRFEVEAEFSETSPALRPGMRGVARIETEKHTLIWVLTHRMFDWLRLTFWQWGF